MPQIGLPVFHRQTCFINETTKRDRNGDLGQTLNEVRQNGPAYCRYVGMEINQQFIKSVYDLESTASLTYYTKQ